MRSTAPSGMLLRSNALTLQRTRSRDGPSSVDEHERAVEPQTAQIGELSSVSQVGLRLQIRLLRDVAEEISDASTRPTHRCLLDRRLSTGMSRSRPSKTLSKMRSPSTVIAPIEVIRPARRAALPSAILHAQPLLFRQLRALLVLLRNRLVHAAGRRIHRRRHDGDRPRVDPRERESGGQQLRQHSIGGEAALDRTDRRVVLPRRRSASSRAAARSAARTTAGLPTAAVAECRCRTGARFLQRAQSCHSRATTQANHAGQSSPCRRLIRVAVHAQPSAESVISDARWAGSIRNRSGDSCTT